jgi:hypothetical protein
MNGRLYDPVLGRFLSPDNYVADNTFTQDFNRYTYARNNPLMYTDPDGESIIAAVLIGAAIGAVVGAYTGGVIANNGTYNPFKWDWNSNKTWNYMLGGASIGAIAGGAGGYVGAIVGKAISIGGFWGGAITGASSGATGGFINGAGMTWLGGGSFGQGLMNGFMGVGIGGITGAILGGTIRGISAVRQGNNFWNGAKKPLSMPIVDPSKTAQIQTREIDRIQIPKDIPDSYNASYENHSYSVTTQQQSTMYGSSDGINGRFVKPATEITYESRLALQLDPYHNFPKEFDKMIIQQGSAGTGKSGGNLFIAKGTVDGKTGVYTILMNEKGTVYHRLFYEYQKFLNTVEKGNYILWR